MTFTTNIIAVFWCLMGTPRGASAQAAFSGSESELEQVMQKMQLDTLDFAAEMERVFAEEVRCASSTLQDCPAAHYDECGSVLPYAECKSGAELARAECPNLSGGTQCSGRYDFFTTSIRLAPHIARTSDNNPTSTEIKEAFCYSKQAEEYMVNKYEEERDYWSSKFGVEPPPRFFGSEDGLFRIHPAQPTRDDSCGRFDTTRRPWYVAATSGPKDVVLILDASGSMQQRGRLDIMIEGAIRVIDTLALGDHMGVVVFSDEARLLHNTMLQATEENKETLRAAVRGLQVFGGTNFLAGFNKAFDLLAASQANEFTSACTSAFLFLSDGENTGADSFDIINSINQRKEALQISPYIFMYGLGASAAFGKAAEEPKAIACATGGMWSHVEDGGDLADSMANYYKLFALGLGEGANEGFVAWVEPYLFSGLSIKGTTVSAPVYDRSVLPPVLVGAVGLDFPMVVMDRALGVAAGSRETLTKLVVRSTAICPALNITNCVLQSLRLEAGTDAALCAGECNEFVGIQPTTCSNQPDLPVQFWANRDAETKSFAERACCAIGEVREFGVLASNFGPSTKQSSQQCMAQAQEVVATSQQKSGGLGTGAIVGIVLGVLGAVVLCGGLFLFWQRQQKNKSLKDMPEGIQILSHPPATAPHGP